MTATMILVIDGKREVEVSGFRSWKDKSGIHVEWILRVPGKMYEVKSKGVEVCKSFEVK